VSDGSHQSYGTFLASRGSRKRLGLAFSLFALGIIAVFVGVSTVPSRVVDTAQTIDIKKVNEETSVDDSEANFVDPNGPGTHFDSSEVLSNQDESGIKAMNVALELVQRITARDCPAISYSKYKIIWAKANAVSKGLFEYRFEVKLTGNKNFRIFHIHIARLSSWNWITYDDNRNPDLGKYLLKSILPNPCSNDLILNTKLMEITHNADPQKTYSLKWDENLHFGVTQNLYGRGLVTEDDIESLDFNSVPDNFQFPPSWDWRDTFAGESNCKSFAVQNQGSCGSCYAFAAASSISQRICLQSQKRFNPDISQQEVMECVNSCAGGSPSQALARGSSTSGSKKGYPESFDDVYIQSGDVANCGSFGVTGLTYQTVSGSVRKLDPSATNVVGKMMYELITQGPFTVGICATGLDMYTSGIFDSTCTQVDHAVNLIGYGQEVVNGESVPFWMIQNSWGSSWGEQGYFRVARGKNAGGVESYNSAVDVVIPTSCPTTQCVNGGSIMSNCSCRCQEFWGSSDCSQCSLQCLNGSRSSNPASCSCLCDSGFFGSSCSDRFYIDTPLWYPGMNTPSVIWSVAATLSPFPVGSTVRISFTNPSNQVTDIAWADLCGSQSDWKTAQPKFCGQSGSALISNFWGIWGSNWFSNTNGPLVASVDISIFNGINEFGNSKGASVPKEYRSISTVVIARSKSQGDISEAQNLLQQVLSKNSGANKAITLTQSMAANQAIVDARLATRSNDSQIKFKSFITSQSVPTIAVSGSKFYVSSGLEIPVNYHVPSSHPSATASKRIAVQCGDKIVTLTISGSDVDLTRSSARVPVFLDRGSDVIPTTSCYFALLTASNNEVLAKAGPYPFVRMFMSPTVLEPFSFTDLSVKVDWILDPVEEADTLDRIRVVQGSQTFSWFYTGSGTTDVPTSTSSVGSKSFSLSVPRGKPRFRNPNSITNTPYECSLSQNNRVECSYESADECVANNCCWQATSNGPWCFKPGFGAIVGPSIPFNIVFNPKGRDEVGGNVRVVWPGVSATYPPAVSSGTYMITEATSGKCLARSGVSLTFAPCVTTNVYHKWVIAPIGVASFVTIKPASATMACVTYVSTSKSVGLYNCNGKDMQSFEFVDGLIYPRSVPNGVFSTDAKISVITVVSENSSANQVFQLANV